MAKKTVCEECRMRFDSYTSNHHAFCSNKCQEVWQNRLLREDPEYYIRLLAYKNGLVVDESRMAEAVEAIRPKPILTQEHMVKFDD